MKKLGFLLLLFVFMWAAPNDGHAASAGAQIVLDGQHINVSSSVKPQIIKGTMMVPFRVISESMGYKVKWNQAVKGVQISSGDMAIKLAIGSKSATVNGSKIILNVAPVIRSGSTLVPLRFIGEKMGVDVSWNDASKTVTLVTKKSSSGSSGSASNTDLASGSTTNTAPVSGNDSTGNANSTGSTDSTGSTNSAGSTDSTGNISSSQGLALVNGISFSDSRMLITTTGTVKPNTFTMAGPNRLIIDLPNAAFSNTFGNSQPLDPNLSGEMEVTNSDIVSKIRYSLFKSDPSTIRVVVDLNKEMSYATHNEGSDLVIVDLLEKSAPTITPAGKNGKKVIVIDAGHGDSDPGASSKSGQKEKDFNLAMVLKVAQVLKQNADLDVILTRSDDTFLPLSKRVQIAESAKADVFISIHANSSLSLTANGTETYYERSSSKDLANTVHKHLVAATQLADHGVRYGNFHVIRETTMPAILLEVGYLSNSTDVAALFSADFQNRVAQGIADGIQEYLGVK